MVTSSQLNDDGSITDNMLVTFDNWAGDNAPGVITNVYTVKYGTKQKELTSVQRVANLAVSLSDNQGGEFMDLRKTRMTQRQYDWLVMISYLSIFFICSGLALALGKGTSYIMSIAYTFLLIILGYINRKELFTKLSWKTAGMGVYWGLIGVDIEIGNIFLVLMLQHISIRSLNTTKILSMVKQLPVFIVCVVLIAPLLEKLVFR